MDDYSEDVIDYVEKNHIQDIKSDNKYSYVELEYEWFNNYLITRGYECFDESFFKSMKQAEEDLSEMYDCDITLRVINYPTDDLLKYLDNKDVGRKIRTTALIKSITDVKLKLNIAIYRCKACGRITNEDQDSEIIHKPNVCEACGSRMGFEIVNELCEYENFRYLQLEEPLELRIGGNSRVFKARVNGYLASPYYLIKAGDVCDICGSLDVVFNEKTKSLEPFINIWHIKPLNSAYEEIKLYDEDINAILELSKDPNIFKRLVESIAPKVDGYDYVKEGLVLQMFEGNRPRDGRMGNGERHLIHILLIGDPGIGKSRLIESIYESSPKAIKSNGAGTTMAGVIATATKSEVTGAWEMSAGSVVLADGGLLTIDEFDKLTKDVMKALNEPMEQLTVSVSKAGIVQTMTARTSILAGANPKYSRFIRERSLEEQLDIPLSTLSRFDLIYVMEDVIDYDNDYAKAMKILQEDFYNNEDALEPSLLKKYVNYAKNNVFPKLTMEAMKHTSKFYARVRQLAKMEEDVAKPITLRELNAIRRMAIAKAKCELREDVTVEDTEEAIRIYSRSLEGLGLSLTNIGELQDIRSKEEMEVIEYAEELISEVYDEYGKIPRTDAENIILTLRTSYKFDTYRIKKFYDVAYKNVIKNKKEGLF